MASFFYSRHSLGFEYCHGAHWQATLVVEGSFTHWPEHLTCSVWADSARYMSIGVVNEYLPSFGCGEDKTTMERS